MTRRVLILDNAVHRHLFKPAWHWRARLAGHDCEVESANVPSGARIPPLDDVTHLILTGSEASILDPAGWIGVEVAAVRDAVDRGIPILGSCFGHQMLVHALSGPEHLRRSERPEVGWTTLELLDDDDLLDGVPRPWSVFSFHFDEVVDPPSPWRVLARSDRCAVQAIRYGDRPVWGLQPHPEIARWKAEFLIRLFVLFKRRAAREILAASRRRPNDVRAIASIVWRFIDHEGPRPAAGEGGRERGR